MKQVIIKLLKIIFIMLLFILNIDTTLMESEEDDKNISKYFLITGIIIFTFIYLSEGDGSKSIDFSFLQHLDPLVKGVLFKIFERILKK